MPGEGAVPAPPPHVLPDVLAANLDIVFCGTAAGHASARRRAYYAGPGNAFWPTLYQVGLTPTLLEPEEFGRLGEWNMGLTDLAKTVSGSDHILNKAHFNAMRLGALLEQYRPKILAFTGKRAAEEFVGHGVDYGLLAGGVGVTRLFVLPSPSGAARRFWSEEPWRALAAQRSLPI